MSVHGRGPQGTKLKHPDDTAPPAPFSLRGASVVTASSAVITERECTMGKTTGRQKAKSEPNTKVLQKKATVQKKVEAKSRGGSKQDNVLGLLRRPEGATIA